MPRTIRRCARCDRIRNCFGRGLCTGCHKFAARNGRRTRQPREEVVEEVEFLLLPRGAEGTAAALGMTPAAIARACYRAGRPDLARPFGRLAADARKDTP